MFLPALLLAVAAGCRIEYGPPEKKTPAPAAPPAPAPVNTGTPEATREPERKPPPPPPREPERRQSAPEIEAFVPYRGEVAIAIRNPVLLSGINREDFARFRTELTREYGQLGFFPKDYDPFSGPGRNIYEPIAFGNSWTDFAEFYVANPYLLIILAKSSISFPFALRCGLPEVQYKDGVIEETYSRGRASLFFKFMEEEPISHMVRICMVNAIDAGFCYATVDRYKCENIDFMWNCAPDGIARSVCFLPTMYGMGGSGQNDIMLPGDQAVLKIENYRHSTRIYIKLWKQQPSRQSDKEDLAYVITVQPS
jgi:hypothetical protein